MRVIKIDKEYKTYVRIYWISYFILIALFIVGIIFKIYPLNLEIFCMFFLFIFFILGVIYCVYHVKLLNYIEKNYHEKWKELTTILGLGPGVSNGFRIGKFLDSEETFDDPIVEKLKSEVRSTGLLCFVNFIIILSCLLIFIFLVFSIAIIQSITGWPSH